MNTKLSIKKERSMNTKLSIKRLFFWSSSALLTLFLMLWQVQANATIIGLESSAASLQQNQQFTIDLWARDLGTNVVSGFDMDIGFDNTAILFQSASFGSLLGDGFDSIQDVVNLGSVINLAELSFLFESDLFALQGGADFILGSLTFVANQTGTTQISIFDSMVTGADPFTTTFSGQANSLTFNVASAQVPEPASWLLFFFALFTGRLARNKPARHKLVRRITTCNTQLTIL